MKRTVELYWGHRRYDGQGNIPVLCWEGPMLYRHVGLCSINPWSHQAAIDLGHNLTKMILKFIWKERI